MLITHSTLPEYSWFAFIVPNLAVAKEIRVWASSRLEGVKMVDVKVTEEIVNLLGEDIEDILRKAPPLVFDPQSAPRNSRRRVSPFRSEPLAK